VRIDQSTIVVTGGAGLIGSTTVDLLLNEHTPRSVVIFDNFSRGSRANIEHALRDPRVSVVNGDISDRAAVARVMAGALRGLAQQPLPSSRGAQRMLGGIDVITNLVAMRVGRAAPVKRKAAEARRPRG